ncbi:50S ribosomal protein L25 [Patescibacteria group bacterium]|jgi:large subunit ribosomal protein L25|nr:50S ribosomal protein L25 [Patescibacteria group bacterium]
MQELAVDIRTTFGKKIKPLRKLGKVPAVIYGKHLKAPVSVLLDKNAFLKAYKASGTSTAITLTGEKLKELVLVADVQLDPVGDFVLHVDFHAVRSDEKVTAEVPVILVGISPVEKNAEGRVQIVLANIEVEAFPQDLPHDIQIDISTLEHVHDVVFVKELKFSDKVEVLTDGEQAVVTVMELSEEEVTNEASSADEAAGAAAAEAKAAAEAAAAGTDDKKDK